MLTGGARDLPERQQTLRATIEWSHRLLGACGGQGFARFAVFAGGATIEAAEEVTGAELDTLSGLVDKRLLLCRSGPVGRPPVWRCSRPCVKTQVERLERAGGDAAEVHRTPLSALPRPRRASRALALWPRARTEWLARLDAEVDNLRAAHDWSIQHAPVEALRLVPALSSFWTLRDGLPEAVDRATAALDAAGDDAPVRERARAHVELAIVVRNQGSPYDREGSVKRGRAHAAQALALSRQVEDRAGIGWALTVQAWFEQGESFPQRRRLVLAEEALACAQDGADPRLIGLSLLERALAVSPDECGADFERAESALREEETSGVCWSSIRSRRTTRSRWAKRSARSHASIRRVARS